DAGAMVTEPAQQSPLPTASVEAPSALPSPPQQASDVPGDLPSSASGSGDVQAADAPPPQDGAPVWGPPSGAAPIAGGADVSPLQAFPEAATELADDDSSVPVLDLGDLTLASPIPDVEPTQQTEPPADGGELPAEMFEPLQPEASPVAVTEAERSEEHTSELQSRENLVCRLLLETKNKALSFLKCLVNSSPSFTRELTAPFNSNTQVRLVMLPTVF